MSIRLSTFISILMLCILSGQVYAVDSYKYSKIVIGNYNKITGDIGSNNVNWTFVKPSHIAIDEIKNIYVLDVVRKRILIFSNTGVISKEIILSNIDFSDKSEDLGDDGYIEYQIEVSPTGEYIYLTEGGKENNWAVIDNKGNILKNNIYISGVHRCCDNILRGSDDRYILNNMLNIVYKINISKIDNIQHIVDSENNIYYISKNGSTCKNSFLIKTNSSGKQIFTKSIFDCNSTFRFIGVDGKNNLYIVVDQLRVILKVNKEGIVVNRIKIPVVPFFNGWIKFKVLCDGTIVCIPGYSALWNENNGYKIDGEYLLYFIEE